MSNILYLIPAKLGECPMEETLPANVSKIINRVRTYIVENERSARRYLISLGIKIPINDLRFFILNKHTSPEEFNSFLDSIKDEDIGLISEAGVPAVADPGSEIVNIAHQKGIIVKPLVGPSSILLALMASGLNGQSFCFHGYLPVKRPERCKRIKELEIISRNSKQTQMFIETPYRNNQLFDDLMNCCSGRVRLSIAANLTLPTEFIKTRTISEWKKKKPDLHKQPAVFSILAF